MSLSDTVNSFGRDISAGFSPNGVCGFAPTEQTYGFIDTSLAHDGSRGIAFLHDGLCVNLYGATERISYESINVRLVESYESGYADELILSGDGREVRITDYSLNKPFLKLLVETLCLRYRKTEEPAASILPQAPIPEADSQNAPDLVYGAQTETADKASDPIYSAPNGTAYEPAERLYEKPDAATFPAAETPKSAKLNGYIPPEIPEEKIEWISGDDSDDELDDSDEELLEEPIGALEGMSREETLSFLLDSIREINTQSEEQTMDALDDELLEEEPPEDLYRQPASQSDSHRAGSDLTSNVNAPNAKTEYRTVDDLRNFFPETSHQIVPDISSYDKNNHAAQAALSEAPAIPMKNPEPARESIIPKPALTKEPPSDDVYITASAKLREACESGKLNTETIENEIKEQLIPAAKVFMEVISQADVPAALAPRIAELKAASAKIKDYFAIGEDVAARVMFFMLYQMLSYSDRIVEDAETKQRLNGFFTRCGPSGITLSMLDIWMRQR